MVVGVLKNGLKGALSVTIIFFVLFISISLFSTTSSISDNSINIIYNLLSQSCKSRLLIILINFLTLAFGAVLISYYSIRQEVVEKQNYIPAFLYLFFGGLTLNTDLIHPAYFANIFILTSLIYVTDSYREEEVLAPLFNAAFFIAIAMFFYINYAFFIVLFVICLLVLRPFNWREYTVGLLGFFAPVFIYACGGYLANFNFHNIVSYSGVLLYYFQVPLVSEYFYPLFFYLIILLFAGVFRHISKGLGSKIKTQKNMGIIYWLMVLSLINFFSKNNNYYFPLIASVIPISILLGDYFSAIKQLKVANTLFFLLLVCGSLLFLVKLGIV